MGGGGGGGVSSLDGLTGALTLVGGTGISIADGVSTITINSTSLGDVTLAAFGSTPNANGASLSGQALTLQPASGSFPGGVSTTTQTFAGVKTFSSSINADGGIDRSTAGTLTIGATNSTIINIGNSGATVNIQGTTIYENTPQLLVVDPLITLNSGGGVGSGQNSGIQIEEAASITGYAETSADRNSWSFKAPNTAGVVTITPGASGFIIDQASHTPLTLTAVGAVPNANGASLSGQALTLQPANTSFPGVLTAADWNTFNGKQAAGNYITALTGDGTASGPGSVALTLATVNSNVGTFASVTVNGKGLVTAATDLSGDATTSGAALTLATVNGNVGSFGSATQVAAFTVNAKGLITAASNTSIQIAESQVTNLVSDLAAKQSTTLASANILVGNGSNVATAVAMSGAITIDNTGATSYNGVVAMNKGGTNASLTAVNGGSVYSTGSALAITAAGTSGQVLTSTGAGAPTYQTVGNEIVGTLSDVTLSVSGTTYNLGNVVLTPGIWIVYGKAQSSAPSLSESYFETSLSSISATLDQPSAVRDLSTNVINARKIAPAIKIVSVLSGTTTIYLTVESTYTGTAPVATGAQGLLRAVKIGNI